VGNGSNNAPFIATIITKKLLQRADREPSSFVLHLDPTSKLHQATYPVLVIGVSDKVRRFHAVVIVIMSPQMQLHYARTLAALRELRRKSTRRLRFWNLLVRNGAARSA
ncbi:hypothetical protein PHYSODRAFT_535059, partial [Phytophthora sojae]